MTSYRVAWVVDVDATSHEEAARLAQAMQRDQYTLATIFEVAPQCSCGEYHVEEIKQIDLMERTHAH